MKTLEQVLQTDTVRVLVIEDNQDDAYLFRQRLKRAHIDSKVHFLEDGRSALTYIDNNLESLEKNLIAIFLDLRLPNIPGLDVLQTIRDRGILQKTHVFVMTSSNDPLDLDACRRLGVRRFIVKPVTLEKFSEVLAELFHN